MNLLNIKETNQNLSKPTKLVNIFVCMQLHISKQPLFIEEFIKGFLDQEYPANLLDILINSSEKFVYEKLKSAKKYRLLHKFRIFILYLNLHYFRSINWERKDLCLKL